MTVAYYNYRTMTDLERKRDRYECVIDIYPPLDGDPTAVAQFVKKYLNAQTVSFSEFRISGILSLEKHNPLCTML